MWSDRINYRRVTFRPAAEPPPPTPIPVLGPLVDIKVGQRDGRLAEELVHAEEVTVQHLQSDLGRVPLAGDRPVNTHTVAESDHSQTLALAEQKKKKKKHRSRPGEALFSRPLNAPSRG